MESEERDTCLWCGGEVYAGEPAFAGNGGLVHQECLPDMLMEKIEFLAEICGFEEVIA